MLQVGDILKPSPLNYQPQDMRFKVVQISCGRVIAEVKSGNYEFKYTEIPREDVFMYYEKVEIDKE